MILILILTLITLITLIRFPSGSWGPAKPEVHFFSFFLSSKNNKIIQDAKYIFVQNARALYAWFKLHAPGCAYIFAGIVRGSPPTNVVLWERFLISFFCAVLFARTLFS